MRMARKLDAGDKKSPAPRVKTTCQVASEVDIPSAAVHGPAPAPVADMAARYPHLDVHGDVAYFTDRGGKRWRVYDASFGPPHTVLGRYAVHPFGSVKATQRIFVPPELDAARHAYTFSAGESRELTDTRLGEQLRRSAVFFKHRLQETPSGPR